jgi:hypothetical protein
MNIVERVKSLNRNVVEAFLDGEDARNRLGSLVSKEYEGVRILQHYETIEAVYYRASVRNIECWSKGFSTCPSFYYYWEYFKKASLPITGLAGVLKLPLSAIAEAVPTNPKTEIPCLLWVKVDGRTYGYETYWESRPANIIVDLDGQAAYMYSIWKRPNYGIDVALDPPVFRFEYIRRLPLTYIYERVRRRYNLRRRYLSRILHLPDLRALRHIGRVEVEIGNGSPSLMVANGRICIYASRDTIFRVEAVHDFYGRRGTVAKVVALDSLPIMPLSSYVNYLNGSQTDDPEDCYPLPSVLGVWLVGRDVTGQLWVTEFDRCFYSYPVWTLDRLAMGLRPDDRIVDES